MLKMKRYAPGHYETKDGRALLVRITTIYANEPDKPVRQWGTYIPGDGRTSHKRYVHDTLKAARAHIEERLRYLDNQAVIDFANKMRRERRSGKA